MKKSNHRGAMRVLAGLMVGSAALVALSLPSVGVGRALAADPMQTPTPLPTGATTSVTLHTAERVIDYGASATLSGDISSGADNEEVMIVNDRTGSELTRTTTFNGGHFKVDASPHANITVHAVWGSAESDPVTIKVRPIVNLTLSNVHLFGKATAAGKVTPAANGAKVRITLKRAGKTVARRSVGAGSEEFSVPFKINKPGKYIAKLRYSPSGLVGAGATSAARKTHLPSLAQGSKGLYVKLLEARLHGLHYFLTGRDSYYDDRTSDAIIAFNKVQGRERSGSVTEATWRALASPVKPHARSNATGTHVEVDQTRQVFYLVHNGNIKAILMASTGAGGATRDGSFQVYRKGGAGSEFYPSYFDGARAFHIWNDVPPTAASHGCVRLPYWAGTWYWNHTPIGTPVLVYHS